jgi:hypothetical protein
MLFKLPGISLGLVRPELYDENVKGFCDSLLLNSLTSRQICLIIFVVEMMKIVVF